MNHISRKRAQSRKKHGLNFVESLVSHAKLFLYEKERSRNTTEFIATFLFELLQLLLRFSLRSIVKWTVYDIQLQLKCKQYC